MVRRPQWVHCAYPAAGIGAKCATHDYGCLFSSSVAPPTQPRFRHKTPHNEVLPIPPRAAFNVPRRFCTSRDLRRAGPIEEKRFTSTNVGCVTTTTHARRDLLLLRSEISTSARNCCQANR